MSKEILGSLYFSASEKFGCGYMHGIYKCVKAEKDDLGVVEMEVKQLGNISDSGSWDNPQTGRVYDSKGISPTINTCQGGQREVKTIVAMRGRNPQSPSDRTIGSPTEQRLEPNSQGICNTLTSVQKDNLLLEKVKIKQATKDGYIECNVGGVADLSYPESKTRRGRVQENGECCPTLTTTETGICKIESQYQIRKLTPMECWKLMDFSEEDFLVAKLGSREVAKEVLETYPHLGKRAFTEVKRLEKMSNTQMYKQAGNSICENVLVAIFGQMIPGKEDYYKNDNRSD